MKSVSFMGTLSVYLFGFGISLILSLLSYLCATQGWFGDMTTVGALSLLGLAVVQMVIQLVCFLHLGAGPTSILKTQTFIFTFMTLLIVVIGSLWIMRNLEYRMGMSPEAMGEYMQKQNKKGF